MAAVTFYKQVRADGGVRVGIEIDGSIVFHQFDKGTEEFDHALVWHIDVRCEGKPVPGTPEEARHWLLQVAPIVKKGLHDLATDLEVGLDIEPYPLRRSVAAAPANSTITIVCSAVHRLSGLQIAQELKKLATQWDKVVRKLPSLD